MNTTKLALSLPLAALIAAAAVAAHGPEPYSFLRDGALLYDRRLPVSWISDQDGTRILRLEGSDDYAKSGRAGATASAALERFRGMEVDFILEYRLEGIRLRPDQWATNRIESFKPVTWHWEHANAEYSSWVRPPVPVPDGGSTDGWVTRRFRACVEHDDFLGKAGIELHATCASGGALLVRDFRVEAAPDAFMDGIVAKAGVEIPDGFRCEYSGKWLDGRKRRGIVAIWSFSPEDFGKIASWGCDLVRMSRFRPLEDDYGKLEERLAVLKRHGVRVVFAPMTPGGKGNRNKYAIFNSVEDRDRFLAGWEKLAAYFKGRDDVWAFGIMNEPFQNLFGNDTDRFTYWELVCEAIRRIRAIDPDRPVVATADFGGSPGNYRLPYMRPYPFRDVWYEIHFYSPLAFTHYGVLGKRIDPAAQSYPGLKVFGQTAWDKEALRSVFDERLGFARKYGARWFVGEFSCMRCMPGAAQWLEDCCDIFDGAPDVDMWAYHSYGEYHGWNLEYEEETPYGGKARKLPPGEEGARMKVMKRRWAENAKQ